jgi:hypothetical protein
MLSAFPSKRSSTGAHCPDGACSVREEFENLVKIRDLKDPVQLRVYCTNDDLALAFLKLSPYVQKQPQHLGGEESYSFKVKYQAVGTMLIDIPLYLIGRGGNRFNITYGSRLEGNYRNTIFRDSFNANYVVHISR